MASIPIRCWSKEDEEYLEKFYLVVDKDAECVPRWRVYENARDLADEVSTTVELQGPEDWDSPSYEQFMRSHSELVDLVAVLTAEILKRLNHKGWLKDFDEYNVTYEWNDSCHCHPSHQEGTFPASWLFDPEWEKRVDEVVSKQNAEQAEIVRKNQEIKNRQEREEYERLKRKFAVKTN